MNEINQDSPRLSRAGRAHLKILVSQINERFFFFFFFFLFGLLCFFLRVGVGIVAFLLSLVLQDVVEQLSQLSNLMGVLGRWFRTISGIMTRLVTIVTEEFGVSDTSVEERLVGRASSG